MMNNDQEGDIVLVLEVRDARSHVVEVECLLEWDIGEVRNAVNKAIGSGGFFVREQDLLPMPWWHYAEDDVEAFAGPGDNWRLMDVCFEQMCAGLRKIDTEKKVRLKMGSLSALGPRRRIGIIFPDSRQIDISHFDECNNSISGRMLLDAAQFIYDKNKALTPRILSLIISLWTLEEALRNKEVRLDEIEAVAGFGFDGEIAALVFVGRICLEDAIRRIMATDILPKKKLYQAIAYVGTPPSTHVHISHYILSRAQVAVLPYDLSLPANNNDKPLSHTLIETLGAHTPYFSPDPDMKQAILLENSYDSSFRFPFYSRGERRHESSSLLLETLSKPVLWADTCRAMYQDTQLTHFLEVGRSSYLNAAPFIFPSLDFDNDETDHDENKHNELLMNPPDTLSI